MKNRGNRLPQKLIERIRTVVSTNRAESVLSAFNLRRPTTIRANSLKISGADLLRQMRKIGVKLDTVFWYKDAFIVKNRPLRELQRLTLYQEGYFYVQNLSSMIPSLILSPRHGEKILDIAAAPGSKTTQMAAMMGNSGEIIANEPNPIRMQKLKTNTIIQGVKNVKFEMVRGEIIYKKYDEYFDKILVDVPCSGEGRVHTYDRDSYRYWSYKKVLRYKELQKKLLTSAMLSLKKGGLAVYSTCTLAPEENEEVIDWLLTKAFGFVSMEEINLGGLSFEAGLSGWQGKDFHKQVRKTVRFYPDKMMEGFFVAKIRKIR